MDCPNSHRVASGSHQRGVMLGGSGSGWNVQCLKSDLMTRPGASGMHSSGRKHHPGQVLGTYLPKRDLCISYLPRYAFWVNKTPVYFARRGTELSQPWSCRPPLRIQLKSHRRCPRIGLDTQSVPFVSDSVAHKKRHLRLNCKCRNWFVLPNPRNQWAIQDLNL